MNLELACVGLPSNYQRPKQNWKSRGAWLPRGTGSTPHFPEASQLESSTQVQSALTQPTAAAVLEGGMLRADCR